MTGDIVLPFAGMAHVGDQMITRGQPAHLKPITAAVELCPRQRRLRQLESALACHAPLQDAIDKQRFAQKPLHDRRGNGVHHTVGWNFASPHGTVKHTADE